MKQMLMLSFLSLALTSSIYAADPAAGSKLVAAKGCVACHGSDGNSTDVQYPALAGQYASYLEHSLKAYRNGERSNAIMAGFAKELSDTEIADLAAFFASQASKLHDLREMK